MGRQSPAIRWKPSPVMVAMAATAATAVTATADIPAFIPVTFTVILGITPCLTSTSGKTIGVARSARSGVRSAPRLVGVEERVAVVAVAAADSISDRSRVRLEALSAKAEAVVMVVEVVEATRAPRSRTSSVKLRRLLCRQRRKRSQRQLSLTPRHKPSRRLKFQQRLRQRRRSSILRRLPRHRCTDRRSRALGSNMRSIRRPG